MDYFQLLAYVVNCKPCYVFTDDLIIVNPCYMYFAMITTNTKIFALTFLLLFVGCFLLGSNDRRNKQPNS